MRLVLPPLLLSSAAAIAAKTATAPLINAVLTQARIDSAMQTRQREIAPRHRISPQPGDILPQGE